MTFLLLFAFFAGIVTVLSPCVLPVLPAILSAGLSGGKWRPLGVVCGIVFSFTFFTLTLTSIVQRLGFSVNLLRYTAILIIGFFGMVMIMPFLTDWFARLTNSVADLGSSIQSVEKSKKKGFFSGFFLGTALGLVWTPCAGPILAAISTLVATQSVTFAIILLTLSFSLGAGLPLLGIAYGGQKVIEVVPFFSRCSEGIRKLFGWIMLLTALALAFNWDIYFQQKVLDYLPNIQVENNARVQQELNKLRPPPVAFPGAGTFNAEGVFSQGSSTVDQLPQLAQAPEIVGIAGWLNSSPLSLKELYGKVVLIDFWTYSCINCIRTFPYLIRWNEVYKDKGLVIVGVHTPEFEFEKDPENVKKALERFHISYPVALDNEYKTWSAYQNAYWPAHYLIDQNGVIRQVHFGEGGYLATENAIRSLLGEGPVKGEPLLPSVLGIASKGMTPEIYLGYKRGANYAAFGQVMRDSSINYSYGEPLEDDQVGLKGLWKVEAESILSEANNSSLEVNFSAKRVYLVLGGESDLPVRVEMDGLPLPQVNWTTDMDKGGMIFVNDARKYDVVDLKGSHGRHRLTLHIPKGIKAYAFTFGIDE
jgi:cytochrome c biogenesis protein CcdA/thiol-disulfide isomerase/thioredoxin